MKIVYYIFDLKIRSHVKNDVPLTKVAKMSITMFFFESSNACLCPTFKFLYIFKKYHNSSFSQTIILCLPLFKVCKPYPTTSHNHTL